MSEYYTVSQYAAIFGKDPGNIRRMLLSGNMEGKKIGNQWLIPQNVKYPEDRRLKSGKYRNVRQRATLNKKHPEVLNSVNKMCVSLKEIYGNDMVEVLLYGSYARGQETQESDVDIAIILRQEQTECQNDKMLDVVVDYQLDMGITVSVITIVQSEFIEWKATLPFYKNVSKEGIIVWKSA